MNLKRSEGFHFPLFVRGGADVCPRIIVGDPRNRQHVDVLDALRSKLAFQLNTEADGSEISIVNEISINKQFIEMILVTLDHLMSGTGYPEATQGRTASDPTVTSFVSGSAAI